MCQAFSSVAWDEIEDDSTDELAGILGLNRFVIGYLSGMKGLLINFDAFDDPDETTAALDELIEIQRPGVLHAFRKSLGNDMKLYEFFCWTCTEEEQDDSDDTDVVKIEPAEPRNPHQAFQ